MIPCGMKQIRHKHQMLPWSSTNTRMPIKEPITLAVFWAARVDGKLPSICLTLLDRAKVRFLKTHPITSRALHAAQWLDSRFVGLLKGAAKRERGSLVLLGRIARTAIRVLFRRSKVKEDLLELTMQLPPNPQLVIALLDTQNEKADPMDHKFRHFALVMLLMLFFLRERLLNPTLIYRPDRRGDATVERWRPLRLRKVTTKDGTKTELEPEGLEDWWAVGEALVLESWGRWENLPLQEVREVLRYDANLAGARTENKAPEKAVYRVREHTKAAFVIIAERFVADGLIGRLFQRIDIPNRFLEELSEATVVPNQICLPANSAET